jgi:hypothetical protein
MTDDVTIDSVKILERAQRVHIALILDRSGSMSDSRHATIEGFNGYLARASALEVDLIALTGHGHGAGSGMPVGSTAHGIVRAAPCPVLLVGTASRNRGSAGSSNPANGIGAATDSVAIPVGIR